MSKIFVSSYVRFLLWSWIAFITSASVIHKAKRRGRLLLMKYVIKSKNGSSCSGGRPVSRIMTR
jgi:hypothetical protein